MPPTGSPSRFNRFNGMLWALFVVIAFYLVAWPPLEGWIAKRYWAEIPCHATLQRFFFEFNGKKYASTRLTLWVVINGSPYLATPDTPTMNTNAVCYVRGNSRGFASLAVLHPRAAPTSEQLVSRLSILSMILAAILVMTWRVRITSRQARSVPVPLQPPEGA